MHEATSSSPFRIYGVAVFIWDLLSPYLASFRRQTTSLWRGELFPLFPFSSLSPKAPRIYATFSWFGKIPYPPSSTTYWVYSSRPHELSQGEERGSRIWMPLNTSWPFYVPPNWYLLPRPRGMRNIETSAEGLSRAPPIVYLFKWKQGLNEKHTW